MASKAKSDTPTPRIGKLDSLADLRREMARVYRESRRGELPTADLTKFVYALRSMADLHEIEVLERRLTELEGKVVA
jgi:hypothetical protein